MAVAAFLLTLSCTMAPAAPNVPQHDKCAVMELQRFDNATLEEIQGCADMADALLLMNRFGTRCEVLPMAEGGETASTALLYNELPTNDVSSMAEDGAKPHRVRYGGHLIQRMYDQGPYTF